jgi:hypothetical protein
MRERAVPPAFALSSSPNLARSLKRGISDNSVRCDLLACALARERCPVSIQ